MAQIGVMLHIPDADLKYLNTKELSSALRSAAAQVQQGSLDGDWTHTATGLKFQIRSVGISVQK
jgi:hypothetical protein